MSLDKAIKHNKEKRKPYRGSKAIDSTCRNHGSCPWCTGNRLHKFRDKHPLDDDEEYGEIKWQKLKREVIILEYEDFCFGDLLNYIPPSKEFITPCVFVRDDNGKAVVLFQHAEWVARVNYNQLNSPQTNEERLYEGRDND